MKERNGRSGLLLGTGLILVLGGALWWASGPSEKTAGGAPGGPSAGTAGFLEERPTALVRPAKVIEHGGKYLLGPEFLDIFNAFRVEYIEKGRSEVLRAFSEWAKESYSEEVAAFLLQVFDKYLLYLERLEDPSLFPAGATMDQKYQILLALRREIFGEEIAKLLFQHEDERVQFALALQAVKNDPDLSEEEKKKKAEELKAGLDPETRERLFPYDAHQDYRERLAKLKSDTAGLPPGEQAAKVRELRLEMFGEEATGRLEELDRVREERAARMDLYAEDREKILTDSTLNDEQKKERIKKLQEERLLPEQLRRVQAIEALEHLTPEEIARRIKEVQEGEREEPDWESPEQRGENVPAPEGN
ncbi:MAG: lipase secretion chaperone [Bdellovibrionota bacterium]